jgi:hypothetical protein
MLKGLLPKDIRRKIFVRYHHAGDQAYYEAFSSTFGDRWELIADNSLEREIDSDDCEYVMRRIRERYIHGTSCTVVLCGHDTPYRKYVDWEIKASLDDQHGLLGIRLPTVRQTSSGFLVPDRLYDNLQSEFAIWLGWHQLMSTPDQLQLLINVAIARPASRIVNSRALRSRNG